MKEKSKMMRLEKKFEIVSRIEVGEGASAIEHVFGINESTVPTIHKKK
jgi:hypothetical protein